MATVDLVLIGLYLFFVFAVGISLTGKAGKSLKSYFLADQNLPWWWAGISIAATTFAADTPLAIAGIIASKGLAGNWFWFSWALLHASVIFLFARMIRKTAAITDAEVINQRYDGSPTKYLRITRALLYGVVINGVVLGWVLKAMVKILTPFLEASPGVTATIAQVEAYIPTAIIMGSPLETIIILGLVMLVGVYSIAGGLKGVVLTDLVQLGIALFGSIWLAYATLSHIGGLTGLNHSLNKIYGSDHSFFNLFPDFTAGGEQSLWIGGAFFLSYLFIQSYANNPADGGGYFFQRLGACRDERHAQKGITLFFIIHYIIRLWPWVIVGLGALVLFPIGNETQTFPELGSYVSKDREMAYPVMIMTLLGPGFVGILLISLISAFMSTIDTHINWGASYIVNDVYGVLKPKASLQSKVTLARVMVGFFAILAIVSATQITKIETAWQMLAAIGAGIIIPTILRWLWWRINAWSEILAIVAGTTTAAILTQTDVHYEQQLILICSAGGIGTLLGVWWKGPVSSHKLAQFKQRVNPIGFWQNHSPYETKELIFNLFRVIVFFLGFTMTLGGGSQVLKLNTLTGVSLFTGGLIVMALCHIVAVYLTSFGKLSSTYKKTSKSNVGTRFEV